MPKLPGTAVAVRPIVNGHAVAVEIDVRTSLLDLLRERLLLTGVKKGCDHGQCGACTVHVDGRRVLSCLTLAAKADGRAVTTRAGISRVHQLQLRRTLRGSPGRTPPSPRPRAARREHCGRVVSPRTAASQMRGGVVWAISAALREETAVDPRYGGWLNNDLADYVVAVNADIGDIDVGFIDRPDPLLNDIGAKGLGEVAMTGASGAVADAIYHATGKRLREMPMRIESLL